MDDVVRKERLCYQQFKSKGEGSKTWSNKEKAKANMGGRRSKPWCLKNFGRDHQQK